jgi:hypothetical protein
MDRSRKNGRKAREAVLSVRAGEVVLRSPSDRPHLRPLTVHVVYSLEENPPSGEEELEWMLLTSEPVPDFDAACRILDDYRMRWRVEDFHKAWKTGCKVEERRMQQPEHMERLAVILAFIAVRLLQIGELAREDPKASCEPAFRPQQWRCLWARMEKTTPPKTPPTIEWARKAVARLGGWSDTKRDGRIGWISFWRGWLRLQDLVEGWELAAAAVT